MQMGRHSKYNINIAMFSCPRERKHGASRGTTLYSSNICKDSFFSFYVHLAQMYRMENGIMNRIGMTLKETIISSLSLQSDSWIVPHSQKALAMGMQPS